MGTDAIGMVEVLQGTKWVPVTSNVWPNPGWKERGEQPISNHPVLPRHYGLFSVLADVRNRTGRGYSVMQKSNVPGYGETEWEYNTDDGGHDPLQFIAEPRGVPKDANQGWKAYCQSPGTHDATWFTLEELFAAPWDQPLYMQGVVIEEDYVKYQKTGLEPQFHSRSVGGPGLRVVNEVEYAAGERGELQTAVDFRWKGKPLREDIPHAWWATLGLMDILAPDNDPTRIRLMICFDS